MANEIKEEGPGFRTISGAKIIDLEELHRHQGWFFALGIALIVLGLLALSSTTVTTFASVMFLGWLLFIGGIVQTIHALWLKTWSGFFLSVVLGILNLVAGALILIKPTVGVLSVTLLLAGFFIASGIIRIIAALVTRPRHWAWLLLNGIITLTLGILVGLQWPSSSLWVIGLFVGIDLVLSGWSLIALAMATKRSFARHQ